MARALPVNRWLTVGAGLSVGLLVAVPVLISAGLYGADLSAFSASALQRFVVSPGVVQSLIDSLVLTLIAPLLACYVALAFSLYRPNRLLSWLSPFLSIPHLAFAVGVIFLFSPTGWWVRALHGLFGVFDAPPSSALLADRSLWTLLWVLVLKEIPFLLLMTQSALTQIPAQRYLQVGQTLGHSRIASWWQLVVPELLTRLRLPMAAVIVYTLSVVDVPLLIGPHLPGVWAQQVFQWQQDFLPGAQQSAVLGGLVLLLLAAVLLWLNRQHERAYNAVLRWQRQRDRTLPDWVGRLGAALQTMARFWLPLMVIISAGVIAALLVWSFASGWFYPALLPEAFSLSTWRSEWPFLAPLLWQTLSLALTSATLGLGTALPGMAGPPGALLAPVVAAARPAAAATAAGHGLAVRTQPVAPRPALGLGALVPQRVHLSLCVPGAER